MTKLTLLNQDISELEIDCIVNTANNELLMGGGVDGCVRRAAGSDIEKEILEYKNKNSSLKTGECFITNGYKLPCKYVIHTVGPYYGNEQGKEEELLKNCYINILNLGKEYKIKKIAFPSISTGIFRYPIEEACKLDIKTVKDFIEKDNYFEEIIFVSFSKKDYKIYKTELLKY